MACKIFFSEQLIRRELGQLQIYLLHGMRWQIDGCGLRVINNLQFLLVKILGVVESNYKMYYDKWCDYMSRS